jgi:hypothetical protein
MLRNEREVGGEMKKEGKGYEIFCGFISSEKLVQVQIV